MWDDFKGMIIFLLVFSLIGNICANTFESLSSLNEVTDDAISKVFIMPSDIVLSAKSQQVDYLSSSYDQNLSGEVGTQTDAWAKKDTTLGTGIIMIDFFVAAWNWVKEFFIAALSFMYSPVRILSVLLSLDSLWFLWWLPMMFYIIWSVLYAISIVSIFTGK